MIIWYFYYTPPCNIYFLRIDNIMIPKCTEWKTCQMETHKDSIVSVKDNEKSMPEKSFGDHIRKWRQ